MYSEIIGDRIRDFCRENQLVKYINGNEYDSGSTTYLVEEIVPIAEVSKTHTAFFHNQPQEATNDQRLFIHDVKLVPYYTPSIMEKKSNHEEDSISEPSDDHFENTETIWIGDEGFDQPQVIATLHEMQAQGELDIAVTSEQTAEEDQLPVLSFQLASKDSLHYNRYDDSLSIGQSVDLLMKVPMESLTLQTKGPKSKLKTVQKEIFQRVLVAEGSGYQIKMMRKGVEHPFLDSRPQDIKDLVVHVPFLSDKVAVMQRSILHRVLVADQIRKRRAKNPSVEGLDQSSKLHEGCLVIAKAHRYEVTKMSERSKTLTLILRAGRKFLYNKILLREKHIQASRTLTNLMSGGYAVLRLPNPTLRKESESISIQDPLVMLRLLEGCITTYIEDDSFYQIQQAIMNETSSEDVLQAFMKHYAGKVKLNPQEKPKQELQVSLNKPAQKSSRRGRRRRNKAASRAKLTST